jgi:hypothetical protein
MSEPIRRFAPFVGLLAAVICFSALDLQARCCSNEIEVVRHVMTLQLGWSIRARLVRDFPFWTHPIS